MPRFAKFGIPLVLAVIAVLFLAPIISGHHKSTLYVHADGLDWTNIIVESENLPQPQSFNHLSPEPQVDAISHGVYRIGVQLANGQAVWSEFFHSDVGHRQRVDIFLGQSSRPGWIRFREVINQNNVLFEAETPANDATKQIPFRLGWI